MGDLVVFDTEYSSLQRKYHAYGKLMEAKYNEYLDVLSMVCEYGISEGEVFKNIRSFKATAEMLRGEFYAVTAGISSLCDSYVDEIDEADSFMYG